MEVRHCFHNAHYCNPYWKFHRVSRVLILGARGRFFGNGQGTRFDQMVVKDIRKGAFSYPGPATSRPRGLTYRTLRPPLSKWPAAAAS